MTTRRQIYDIERSYVRAKSYGRKNIFNNQQDADFCGYFQKYCFKRGGMKKWIDKFSNFSYCPAIMSDAKKLGYFRKTPARGDLVLFDWDKNGVPNHVGFLVKKVKIGRYKGLYKTVEANVDNACVKIKYRSPSLAIGFVRPPYEKPKKKKKKKVKSPEYPTLKKGSHGEYVKILQKKLKITADGIFGPKTEKAVKTFQKKHKLKVDGIVGKNTWKKLMK